MARSAEMGTGTLRIDSGDDMVAIPDGMHAECVRLQDCDGYAFEVSRVATGYRVTAWLPCDARYPVTDLGVEPSLRDAIATCVGHTRGAR